MNFLEKDLEEIIYTTNREILKERGLEIKGKLYRQLRIGNYGIADLVSVEKQTGINNGKFEGHYFNITIYELKKDKIGISAFLQAMSYLKGISDYVDEFYPDATFSYNIVLIGRSVDKYSSFLYMPDFIYNVCGDNLVQNITCEFGIDGIEFKEHYGYSLSEKGFTKKRKK